MFGGGIKSVGFRQYISITYIEATKYAFTFLVSYFFSK